MTNISRNYNRGKSFRFDGTWDPRQIYKNDDFVQDFVTYKGVLYACKSAVPCMAKVPHQDSIYWDPIIEGVTGGTFTPHIDEEGNLTWTNNAELANPEKVNIKGPAGKDGLSAYQIWLNAGNSGSEEDFLESLKGSATQTTNWDFWKTD